MKLFRKSTPEKTAQPSGTETPPPAAPTAQPARPLTAEEAARQWFSEHFGTDMPDEVARMFRQFAQAEAKRQKAGEHLLDDNELKRIQDSIRLYRTKLANITQTLEGLQSQKNWLHKFKELNGTLEKYRQAFFASNKNYSAHLKEIKELERFEAFEEVQGDYQRIKVKEAVVRALHDGRSQHVEQLAAAQDKDKEKRKLAEAANKRYKETLQQAKQARKALAEAYRAQATLAFYESYVEELSRYKARVEKSLEAARKSGEEAREELKKSEDAAAQQQQTRQNMESQQRMLEKGDVIQVRLGFLQMLKKHREQLQADLERMQRKQHEQDEKLNKLFLTSQEADAQINTLQGELHVHQKSILGQNSYNLQQRAMDLKSKKEMLANAIALWKQISEGYARVDEKGQEIMRMKLHNDALKEQIAQLEPEVAGLQTQCEELKYAYTLSKSQDVMQLRKDLQEGVSCSVCGATHHPFHSDTLLEQSKIIGEIKIDFEQTATELKHKQAALDDLKREQAVEEGHIEVGHKVLETYKQILQDHVEHWENFVELDRSFKDCSGSTNFEGRRIMLQQLLEKTGQDAEGARQELDVFNQHQASINALNEKIALKEQERDEIAVRLNEVNTGCQVVAYRVEELQQNLSRTNGQYGELFEEIDKMMTLSNWHKVWNDNPETLRIYIQQQMERWFKLMREMADTKNNIIRLRTQWEMTQQHAKSLAKQRDFVNEKIEQLAELRDMTRGQLLKAFPDGDVDAAHKKLLAALCAQEEEMEDAFRQAGEAHALAAHAQGYGQHAADTIQDIDAQIAEERSKLDVWIRKYNAHHSPVQFPELEQTFSSAMDWNALRREARDLTLQNMLAEARVEEARVALAAHQVNALSQGQDKEDRTTALNTEIARLESERERIQVQIAGCQARLDAHELGLQKLAAGENQHHNP